MKSRAFSAVAAAAMLLLSPAEGAAEVVTLSLPEALSEALANNLQLKNAAISTAQSEKDLRIAESRRLPEVGLEGSYSRFDTPSSSDIPIPGVSFPESEADVALRANMPLYTGGRISSSLRQAETGATLSEETENLTKGEILLEAAAAFLELLAAQRFVVIAGESLDSSRTHLDDVRLLLEKGQVAQVDLFRSELDEAERERDIASADANLTRRSEQLASIIFPERIVSPRAEWEVPEPQEPLSIDEWLALASEGSLEISSARLALTLAQEQVAAARAEHRPSFGLFGSYGARDEDFAYTAEDRYWNAGLRLSFPLYRGGRTVLDVEKALLEENRAANVLAETRRRVHRGVVERYAAVVLARRQTAAAVKAVRAAEENLRVTNLKYREGLVTNTDVIDALLSLSRARFDRVQALKDFHINRFGLMRLAGTIEEIL